MSRPNTVNILAGLRSYKLQIWWELPPWVAGVYSSKMEAVAGMQKLMEEDECSRLVAKGTCSGSAHTKSNFSVERGGDLTGMKVCDPLNHANATSKAVARSPRSSLDLPDGGVLGYWAGKSMEDSFPSRVGLAGLSPSPSALENLEEMPCVEPG